VPDSLPAVLGLLRPGLLEGLAMRVAGGAVPAPGVVDRCTELGAAVERLTVDPFGDELLAPSAAGVLVWDGPGVFSDSVVGVRAALDGAWLAIRATLGASKIVLLAPADGSAHADAARAGLENLARTTSIEWSGRGCRVVTVLGGETGEVAETVAYLASPAGDYFSGCALRLG
jgi:NAD(P)-dependent dehydrogenase (short-subunit alcohol dehydrogenase family)